MYLCRYISYYFELFYGYITVVEVVMANSKVMENPFCGLTFDVDNGIRWIEQPPIHQ